MIIFNITRIRQKKLIRWIKHHGLNISDEPDNLDKITKLSLRFKGINEIPREIRYLTNLEEIDFSYNLISDIPWEFGLLKNIKYINFSYNQLIDIPGVICRHVPLNTLNLEGNKIKKVPAIIANLINLERLNLAFNEIVEIPSEFKYLVSLKELDLAANKLYALPSSFSKLPSLQVLKIWENLFEQRPKELEKITTLNTIEEKIDYDRINKLLVEAVRYDNIGLARRYLALGADINYRWEGYEGLQFTTPLFEAHSLEMVKFLIENGADVNISRTIKKSENILIWEKEKEEQETFLTQKHSNEIIKYLKSIELLKD